MTAGLESRFKQAAYSRLCSKVSGFNPFVSVVWGKLQDYLKIAMESKTEPEAANADRLPNFPQAVYYRFNMLRPVWPLHLLIYQTHQAICKDFEIFFLGLARFERLLSAAHSEYQGVGVGARILWRVCFVSCGKVVLTIVFSML